MLTRTNLISRNLVKQNKRLIQTYGAKTKEEIVDKIHKHNINTITMGFPDLYGRFIGKKYDSDYFIDKVFKSGSNACNYLISCDMGFNPLPNSPLASYERGFGDFTMKSDVASLREINYINTDQRQLLFFSDLYDQNDKPITHAPRYLARKALNELKELGVNVSFQADINFNILADKYKKISEHFNLHAVTEHSNQYNTLYKQNLDDFLIKLKQSLKVSGISVNWISGDHAYGQFKISMNLADPIEFCDNVTLLKLCAKKLADDNDKTISFMAKLFKDCYGNSMNLKFTLKNNEGVSIVNDTLGENAISGILKHLNDFMIFYAPTVNAYKRLKEPSLTQNWNKMGRMTESNGVNILTENYTDKVLFMIPGSDANPYFTVFALLTSMKQGIVNKHTYNQTLEAIKTQTLPINLHAAFNRYDDNEYLKNLLGKDIHQHFGAFYNFEFTEYMNQVDDWELNRYLFNI